MMMRERGLKKDPSYNYLEYEGRNHLFVADDRRAVEGDLRHVEEVGESGKARW